MKTNNLTNFVLNQNKIKSLLTPGPASLLPENIQNIRPCFGRGDNDYFKIEKRVLQMLKKISSHKHIARMQGSASLALEILTSNFLYGKILIIDTGVYSDRIKFMANFYKNNFKKIKRIESVRWNRIDTVDKKYDWIFGCPTETSVALRIPINKLYKLKKKTKAKLALDATASIGLEKDHHLADVIAYSSCKGLFGLTGASFIAFNNLPENKMNSFYLNIQNHLDSKMTGPYHTILSLHDVLQNYEDFKYSVKINKKRILKIMSENLIYPVENQPLLCTYIKKKLISRNKKIIFYKTRANISGSVVCHLGEVHLKRKAKGKILNDLRYE